MLTIEATENFIAYVRTRTAAFLNNAYRSGVFNGSPGLLERVALHIINDRGYTDNQRASALKAAYGRLLQGEL